MLRRSLENAVVDLVSLPQYFDVLTIFQNAAVEYADKVKSPTVRNADQRGNVRKCSRVRDNAYQVHLYRGPRTVE